MSVFQPAWFGKINCCSNERANHGNLFAAQKKRSVCLHDAKMTACAKCETAELIKWMNPGLYFDNLLKLPRFDAKQKNQ